VPRRQKFLENFTVTDAEWESLRLPINLAFFVRNAAGQMTAMYPSPGGAIESALTLDMWNTLAHGQPKLSTLEPEVEALLVNRIGEQHAYVIVPIDACYKLVGLIRMKWRGLSGGTDVWGAISGFFRDLGEEKVYRA
jgi:hypothetical protein